MLLIIGVKKKRYPSRNRRQKKSYREFVVKTIEYSIVPSAREETFDGVITTINESGICLLTTKHLPKGQKIAIKDNDYLTEKAAIVKWSLQYDNYFYKVGMRFSER